MTEALSIQGDTANVLHLGLGSQCVKRYYTGPNPRAQPTSWYASLWRTRKSDRAPIHANRRRPILALFKRPEIGVKGVLFPPHRGPPVLIVAQDPIIHSLLRSFDERYVSSAYICRTAVLSNSRNSFLQRVGEWSHLFSLYSACSLPPRMLYVGLLCVPISLPISSRDSARSL